MFLIPVLISINSNAHREEIAEDETIQVLTSGTLELSDEKAVLCYEEQIEEGSPAQKVTVVIEDDTATMRRDGEYATDMVFRMGSRYEGVYHTPFGDMELAIFCTRLTYDFNEDGGEMQLSYQLDLNGKFAAVHDMELRLLRQGND